MSRDNSCGNLQTQFDLPNQLKNLGCYWIQLLENKMCGVFLFVCFPFPIILGEKKKAQSRLAWASTQQWKEFIAFLVEIGEHFIELTTLINECKRCSYVGGAAKW